MVTLERSLKGTVIVILGGGAQPPSSICGNVRKLQQLCQEPNDRKTAFREGEAALARRGTTTWANPGKYRGTRPGGSTLRCSRATIAGSPGRRAPPRDRGRQCGSSGRLGRVQAHGRRMRRPYTHPDIDGSCRSRPPFRAVSRSCLDRTSVGDRAAPAARAYVHPKPRLRS